MMNSDENFVDYYEVMQVDPNCDAKILEAAYHYLAKLHHPDRTGVTDTKEFNNVIQAYKVLRSPSKRTEYDRLYAKTKKRIPLSDASNGEGGTDIDDGIEDSDDHIRILLQLYKKRREDAQNPGVVGVIIQESLECSDEHFEFHKWYLKEKGLIMMTDQGTLAITIDGVDFVMSLSQTTKAEKLLIGYPGNTRTE